MKRTWIWGTCATIITGSALTLAQQEGPSLPPPTPPVAAAGAPVPVQDVPPVAPPAAVAPVAGVAGTQSVAPPTAPPAGAVRASNDPFAGVGTAAAPRTDPFSSRPVQARGQASAGGADWDSIPSQNVPNTGGFGKGPAFSAQGGFSGGPSSGFGRLGGNFNANNGQNFFNKQVSAEAKAFHEAEQKVQQLAGRIRTTATESPNYAKVDEELKAAVKAAFEARQAMQKAEVKRLKDKLAEIEAQVSRRETAKDVLIEDRYYDLKNGSGGGTPAGIFTPSFGGFPSPNSFPVPSDFPVSDALPAGGGVIFSTAPATSSPLPEKASSTTTPVPETSTSLKRQ